MSSDGKLYRLPTSGCSGGGGTTGPPVSLAASLSNRAPLNSGSQPHQRVGVVVGQYDLNNNQVKSTAINIPVTKRAVSTSTSASSQVVPPPQQQHRISAPAPLGSSTRRPDDVQVSLVINRPSSQPPPPPISVSTSHNVDSELDLDHVDVKTPFNKTASDNTKSKETTSAPIRRSSTANLASITEPIPIDTPEAKIVNRKSNRKNLFKSLFCCFSSSPRRRRSGSTKSASGGSQQQQQSTTQKNGNLPSSSSTANNLTMYNENYAQTNANTANQPDKQAVVAAAAADTTATNAKLLSNDQLAATVNAQSSPSQQQQQQPQSINKPATSNTNSIAITNNSATTTTTTNNNENMNNSFSIKPSNLINTNLNTNNNLINNNNTINIAANSNTNPTTMSSNYIASNLTNTFYPNDYQTNYEKFLLPPVRPSDIGKKCLIIDLDETLVHSSFKQVHNPDFIVPVEIDGIVHQVYVLKRPHVDEFLKRMGELFECVLFTASLSKYADPVSDLLDKWGVFRARLFREACVYYRGNYVKDLSRLGRDLNKVLILDNSPASYIFHPDNAVACQTWFDDAHDTELRDLIPYFERLAAVDSVYTILRSNNSPHHHHGGHHHHHLSHLITACGGSFASGDSLVIASAGGGGDDGVVPMTIQSSPPPPSSPNSVIYQLQQPPSDSASSSPPSSSSLPSLSTSPARPLSSTSSTLNNLNYLINSEGSKGMLLSIDMMMASKQQQQLNNKQQQQK